MLASANMAVVRNFEILSAKFSLHPTKEKYAQIIQ